MNFKIAKPKLQKDTEASSGANVLFTVNVNKLTASPTAKSTLGLDSTWDKDVEEGGTGKVITKGNEFNISILTDDEGKKRLFMHVVPEGGYSIGKNNSVSAPEKIREALEAFGKTRESYLIEGDGHPRSFRTKFDVNPTSIFIDEEGNASFTADDTHTTEVSGLHELTYMNDVVKAADGTEKDATGDATGSPADASTSNTEDKAAKKGRKANKTDE